MFRINTSRRTDQREIMDDFDLKGFELRSTLQDLDNINKWLGGNKITLKGIENLLKDVPKSKTIRIADIGCGNGAILRKIAKWGDNKGYNLKLFGVDANPHAIEIGEELSSKYPNLSFLNLNIFSSEFQEMEFDIILCTLTLHHFKNEEIIKLLDQLYHQSTIGVVINDLQRSKAAYVLFKAFCAVFVHNEIARKDGLISILRGFKK
ncbi:MAG: methyltransferase domain-containing protein, partial [Christiangramia sp.]